MPDGDLLIVLLLFLYPILLLGYLVFLSWIPRLPRFIAYGVSCAVNLSRGVSSTRCASSTGTTLPERAPRSSSLRWRRS